MKTFLTSTMALAVVLTFANFSDANAFCASSVYRGAHWHGHYAHAGWGLRGHGGCGYSACCGNTSCCCCATDFWGNRI